MKKEKIQVYCRNDPINKIVFLDLPKDAENMDFYKRREAQGFESHYETNLFYNLGDDEQLLRAFIFIKEGEKFNEYIFEIWDCGEQIFKFYCENDLDYFNLMQKFIEMRQRAMEYEKDVRLIRNDEVEK